MRSRALLLLLVLAACQDERVAALQAEIGTLAKERVKRELVERARDEVVAVEAELEQAQARVDALGAAERERAAARDRMREALQREIERNAALRGEIASADARIREASARATELRAKLDVTRADARSARDAASAFARELRADDPAWAVERRTRALAEFLRGVAARYPDDPVLRELAADASRPSLDPERAKQTAESVRDRIARVYQLEKDPLAQVGSK